MHYTTSSLATVSMQCPVGCCSRYVHLAHICPNLRHLYNFPDSKMYTWFEKYRVQPLQSPEPLLPRVRSPGCWGCCPCPKHLRQLQHTDGMSHGVSQQNRLVISSLFSLTRMTFSPPNCCCFSRSSWSWAIQKILPLPSSARRAPEKIWFLPCRVPVAALASSLTPPPLFLPRGKVNRPASLRTLHCSASNACLKQCKIKCSRQPDHTGPAATRPTVNIVRPAQWLPIFTTLVIIQR